MAFASHRLYRRVVVDRPVAPVLTTICAKTSSSLGMYRTLLLRLRARLDELRVALLHAVAR